jgi:hypothetical protein
MEESKGDRRSSPATTEPVRDVRPTVPARKGTNACHVADGPNREWQSRCQRSLERELTRRRLLPPSHPGGGLTPEDCSAIKAFFVVSP